MFACAHCPSSPSTTFVSIDHLELHIATSHVLYSPYICELCQFAQFPTDAALREHCATIHQQSIFRIVCNVTPELQARHRQVKEILTRSLMQRQQCEHVDGHEQQTVIVTNSSDIDIKKVAVVGGRVNTAIGSGAVQNFTATSSVGNSAIIVEKQRDARFIKQNSSSTVSIKSPADIITISGRAKLTLPICEPRQLRPKTVQLRAIKTTIVTDKQLPLHGRARGRPKGPSIKQKRQLSARQGCLTRAIRRQNNLKLISDNNLEDEFAENNENQPPPPTTPKTTTTMRGFRQGGKVFQTVSSNFDIDHSPPHPLSCSTPDPKRSTLSSTISQSF